MNIREALAYLKEHYLNLTQQNKVIVGAAYTPELNIEGEFQFVLLSFASNDGETLAIDSQNADDFPFIINVEGGYIGGKEGYESCYMGDSVNEVLKDLPDFILTGMRFHIYEIEEPPIAIAMEFAFTEIFPELPSPDLETEEERAYFKEILIKNVQKANEAING
ncbi:hypothetical protein OFK41_14135 [Acinetobacter baumannii]|uniref:hypothetical protein n=1 Tax=Acinetobacter baumannii TaxID=470 RepID=UPI00225A88E4|nr:hypothetical protein [Acinetobacter baumannii]MCX3035339.1 hypothetical protein [Acinetobacter baumannii]